MDLVIERDPLVQLVSIFRIYNHFGNCNHVIEFRRNDRFSLRFWSSRDSEKDPICSLYENDRSERSDEQGGESGERGKIMEIMENPSSFYLTLTECCQSLLEIVMRNKYRQ